ncbi:MAG TPA: hypothetical protein VF294_06495 [Polyangiaceae bacterium]
MADSRNEELLSRTGAAAEPPCDFLAHLSERLRLESGDTLELLGRWLERYESRCHPPIRFLRGFEAEPVEAAEEHESLAVA